MKAILLLAVLALNFASAIAQEAPRLTRPAETDDSTFGQITLDTLAPLYPRLSRPNDVVIIATMNTLCTGPLGGMIGKAGQSAIRQRFGAKRIRYASLDTPARVWIATEVAATLDEVDSARIRQDEAISPGVYHPIIAVLDRFLETCPRALGAD